MESRPLACRKPDKVNKPAAPADNTRLQEAHQVGNTYNFIVNVAVNAKGTLSDWGIEKSRTIIYGGTFKFRRFIKSNNGSKLIFEMHIDEAAFTTTFTSVDVRLDLPPMFTTLIDEVGASTTGLPIAETREITVAAANKLLNSDYGKYVLSKIAPDPDVQIYANIDSLQGKTARIEYENGKGVTSITPTDCSMSSDEQEFLFGLSVCSDVFTMKSWIVSLVITGM